MDTDRRRHSTTARFAAGIERRIARDPAFAVTSADGRCWFCPYTGAAVPLHGAERNKVIRTHLRGIDDWRHRDPLPLPRVLEYRWRYELQELLPREPRLHIFSRRGAWLNPFTGHLEATVVRSGLRLTAETIAAMARCLAACPQAQNGGMLERDALMASMRAIARGEEPRAESPSASSQRLHSLQRDLDQARVVQEHMLNKLPRIPGLDIGIHYLAQEGVSGDFYDVIPLDEHRWLFVLGDVSGHGMQAGLLATGALKTIRFLARDHRDPVALLAALNDELRGDLQPGQFVTCCVAIYDELRRQLSCCLAGHHPLLHCCPDSTTPLRLVGHSGMALGLRDGSVFASSLHPERITLRPGDRCLQYSDAAVEAEDGSGEAYGRERIWSHIVAPHDHAESLVRAIADDLLLFCGGSLEDDMTLLAISVPGDAGRD